VLKIVERDFNKVGGTEDRGINLQIWQTGLQLGNRRLDALGGFKSICPGILFDDQKQSGPAVNDGLANKWPRFRHDVRHIAEREGRTIGFLFPVYRHLGQFFLRHNRRNRSDMNPLVGAIDEPASADDIALRELKQTDVQRFGRRFHDFVERYVMLNHPLGIDLHLRQLDALTPDCDIRYTRDLH